MLESIKKVRSPNYARTKGHKYERDIAKLFRELGYTRTKSTREASRLMDNAKIDLYGLPFNVQCKAVEAKINYKNLIDLINEHIVKLVPERSIYPTIVFHKKDRDTLVVLTLSEFTKLIKLYEVPVGFS